MYTYVYSTASWYRSHGHKGPTIFLVTNTTIHACFKQFTKHTLITPSVKEHMHCMLLGTEVEAASPSGIPGIPPTIASYNIQDK